MARPTMPVESMRELIDWMKKNPGKLNFATAGNVTKLGGALLTSVAGADLTFVPFNGNGPAALALLGGHVDVLFASPKPNGNLKTLAVTSLQRFQLSPDVPTISESGAPGYDITAWVGVIAPAGTPREVVDLLNREINVILKMEDVRTKLADAQVVPAGGTPEEFGHVIREESAKWAKVAKEAGIKPE
jgi:tripartite-type tricarboxylate transporter receptor subunit TctC